MSERCRGAMITLIDNDLLDAVAAAAQASPRRRKNRNFHPAEDFPCHRLLNGIEPGSYVAPHRHLDENKDETMLVLRGRVALVTFDDAGQPVQRAVLAAGSKCVGVDIGHGTWHTVFALAPGSIFLEAKAGPYLALSEAERAPWAPAEGAPAAASYLEALARLFAE